MTDRGELSNSKGRATVAHWLPLDGPRDTGDRAHTGSSAGATSRANTAQAQTSSKPTRAGQSSRKAGSWAVREVNAINPEPVVGWRLWRVREGELHSWAVEHVWQPGENMAECFADEMSRCPRSPGKLCRCGFWALFTPTAAMRLAAEKPTGRAVMGLIKGYGTVALHGAEGFRAEMATVTCIFADEISLASVERLWRGLQRRFRGGPGHRPLGSTDALKKLASHYGVPLVSLQSALSLGLLNELGVARDAITELQGWLAQQPPGGWHRRPTEHA